MLFKILFVIVLHNFKGVLSEGKINDYYHIYRQDDSYRGEKFPVQYLSTDGETPTHEDFTNYLSTLYRVVDYFSEQLNDTDPNVAIGSYIMKAILKRVLLDYGDKIKDEEKAKIKIIIYRAEDVLSYYCVDNLRYGPGDLGYDLSRLFKYDDSLVASIGKLNKNALQKWITSNLHLHQYTEQFDNLTLPKEQYCELVIDMGKYFRILDSDTCLSKISLLQLPVTKNDILRPCHYNKYCEKKVLAMPSVAYALSHRLLYMVLVSYTRRCYIVSEAIDKMHIDIMCANMYREAVYLARRGYFYRDLFMEHIAICAMIGYEEFYRRRWFKKTASWIDEDGCMKEFPNFELNRTSILMSRQTNSRAKKNLRRRRSIPLNEECAHHQMALSVTVLAYGMRHAAHYMETSD